jgi:hypothetical protein
MTTIPLIENDTEKQSYYRSLAVGASNDAVRFRIVERFLCEVERWLLKPSGPVFDVSRVKQAIGMLKTATGDDSPSALSEAESHLDWEFQLWQRAIEEKDRSIETYNFRRFCDSSAEPLDKEIYVSLASFYRSRPYSHSSQSKFDLVVTRLFIDVDGRGRRTLRFNSKDIARNAEAMLGPVNPAIDAADRFLDNAGAIAAIHSFIAEAQALADFESLIECKLFDRYREFKQELREQLFEPAVIAAAVQCNVVFANAFNEMLEAANESLSESLTSDIDIPAALHDPSPEAQTHLSDALKEFFDLGNEAPVMSGRSGSDHIWELLSLAREKAESAAQSGDSRKAEFDVSRSARERLMPFLETLTKQEPDAALLLSQLNRSRSLQNVRLADFLYAEDHSADMRSRRILGLILWSEEFLQYELGSSESLTPTAQHEVLSLIQKSEEFATALRREINEADDAAKSRLLSVQNALLESQLRLEGAIVKFTNRNLTQGSDVRLSERVTRDIAMSKKDSGRKSSARWLLWFLLIAALLAAAYYFYPHEDLNILPAATNTEKIDVNRLPNHESVSSAYGRGNTLFVTAGDAWLKLPADEKKKALKNFLDYQGASKYESVVIRDAGGHLLGNISAYGVYVPEDAKPESNK